MKRNTLIVFGIVLGICLFVFIFSYGSQSKLVSEGISSTQKDDFILHVRVEEVEKGIRVHHSLQYIGKEKVEIKHQTPLVSVSLSNKNHDYTGSTIKKTLNNGNIYYQEPVIIAPPQEEVSELYVQAKFFVDDEWIYMEHVETLYFN